MRLGASGWSSPAWLDVFYPSDMPEEWRLTFFNTQFGCVFLAQEVWQLAEPGQRAQWIADTHEQFVFLLEADSSLSPPEEMASKALCLKADDARILWFSADSSLKDLALSLSGGAFVKPEFIVSQDGNFGQIERVTTLLEVLGL